MLHKKQREAQRNGVGQKWARRSATRPEELVSAAFEVFAEEGFAGARLEDVAERAGVSRGTVYRYFRDKVALFEAAVREVTTPRFAEAEVLFEAHAGPMAEMLRTVLLFGRQMLRGPMPSMCKLLVCESGKFPKLVQLWVEAVLSRMLGLVERILQKGMERGEFRKVDAKSYLPLIMGPLIFLGVAKETFQGTAVNFDEDAVLEAHIDMLLRGLVPTAPLKGKA